MSLFYRFYKAVGSLPLAFPHEGYEGELLASGAKSIAMITHVESTDRPWARSRIKQLEIADRAVAEGKLLKQQLTTGNKAIWHFYCLPGYEAAMQKMVDHMVTQEQSGAKRSYPAEKAAHDGWRDADLVCPTRLKGAFLEKAAPIVRYCRVQALKHEAKTGTIQLPSI